VTDLDFKPGDRVVHLQVPGVFTVVARRKSLVDLESGKGLRMTVQAIQLRRLEGPPPEPKDA
jgi:hypothetical protein